jgi:NTE family protein
VSFFDKVVRSARAIGRELAKPVALVPKPEPKPPRPVIGVALGGGFARGLAHIGVLKVLEEEKIPIDYIAGTSVGALIGAAYCGGLTPQELESMSAQVRFRDFARWTISRLGLASNERMTAFLNRILRVKCFEELRIPLAITATDFITGEAVVFRQGPLVDPVRASCAYPGMFLPVKIGERLYIDGMLAHSVPTEPLRADGANRVLAVYLSAHWAQKDGPRHVFDVIGQCFSIAQQRMCSLWQAHADIIVEPDVAGFSYDSFERASELVRAGELVARQALPQIRSWLELPAATAPKKVRPVASTGPAPALAD